MWCGSLARKVDLIEPLKELAAQEGGTDFMCAEHAEILQCADELLFEFKEQPSQLERYATLLLLAPPKGTVTDLAARTRLSAT
jgi:hypothetical protein